MSSLDLRVLVLERQRWQMQQDLDSLESLVSGGGLQPHDATLDAFAALVGTPDTLSYFTATEVMNLTAFTAYSRSLLALGDAGTWRSSLGLSSGSTITASGTATYAAYWSAATTLTSTDAIQINPTGWKVGLNSYPPPVNVGLRGYTTSLNSLRLNAGDDVVARWALDCPAQAHILQLGVYYGPDVAATDGVDLRVWRARIDQMGVGYRADSGYALRASSTALDSLVMLGAISTPDRAGDYQYGFYTELNAAGGTGRFALICNGTAACQFNGPTTVLNTLYVSGATHLNSTLYMGGTAQFASRTGMGYAPDGTHWIRAGIAYFDQTGFGGGADTRFTVRSWGHMYCDGTPYAATPGPWQAYSDRRMKHNIHAIPHPLETMCALRGIMYEFNDTEDGKPAGVRMGVLAQEVEQVLPQWVGELSGFKTTQLSQFEALCIESIKALAARVAALEHTNAV